MSSNPEQNLVPFLDVDQCAPGKHHPGYHAGERPMPIELEVEEHRLAELDLLRDQRSLLLEQMNEITRVLAELDQRIAELEQRP